MRHPSGLRVAVLGLGLVALGQPVWAQSAAPPRTPRVHALEHARVVVSPGKTIEDATVVVRDGVIVGVGAKQPVPADARLWDCTGRTIYAGLVEPWWDRTPVGKPRAGGGGGEERNAPKPDAAKRGAVAENPMVHPELDVAETLALESDELDDMRALGFTVAQVVPTEGVWRGRSAVVALRSGSPADQVIRAPAVQVLAFARSRGGQGRPSVYPSSVMGSVALARQSLLDAGWARACRVQWAASKGALPRPPGDASLEALAMVLPEGGRGPVWVRSEDVLDALRGADFGREFNLDVVLVGNGDEYRQLESIRQTALRLVVPVDFPDPPAVDDDDEALDMEYEALRHWEAAPENPARLHAAGVPFAITTHGLRKRAALRSKLRAAIERGLPPDAALAALTIEPARFLGLDSKLGSIEVGKLANLTITDGDYFAAKTRVVEVWVDGDRYEVRPKGDPIDKLRGEWKLVSAPPGTLPSRTLRVEGTTAWTLRSWLEDAAGRRASEDTRLDQGALVVHSGTETLTLTLDSGKLTGTSKRVDGTTVAVAASRGDAEKGDSKQDDKPDKEATHDKATAAAGPPGGLDWPPKPEPAPRAVFIRGATIWTCGPAGQIDAGDLVAVDGKIQAVGRNLTPPSGAVIIEAHGMHLTPGLIDCHSHSNIVGNVNEGTNNCTAEVRIADVLNSESIGIYRELAGGLTTANELHGSANSIGGQNAVMKLRWGAPPAALRFEGAPPGIKFALGENPKQSNWGSEATGRYPQTRMGVEQSIRERFMAARDYMRQGDAYKKNKNSKTAYPPRRDLQLEALAEVLRGERLVHCHSYRADEILMMMRVAEEFGFRVATFQHVLEGYKIADELVAHGAGASCFSDWWAYKFEVYDAIPYAGALMHDRGVVVSFNSDSNELARHLYVEAAKAVKYGGVPEQEALDFVTLNPAKQLRIDKRVGSLEVGKDADFALWSDSPLAATTHCEQTWIEGRRYFDREVDRVARAAMESERRRLIERARAARKSEKDEEGEASVAWHPSYWADDGDASCHEEGQP